MTYSSPAHATVTCVSPPLSPAQASETYCSPTGSPHSSPAPHTGNGYGLTVARLSPALPNSSLDVKEEVSSVIKSSVLPDVVQLDSGLVKHTDCIRQTSPTPASSLPDDSSAVSPIQARLSQVSQCPASPLYTHDGYAVGSTASGSPLYQRPVTPVDATYTQASPSHASPDHSSPTQDNTAMPSTSHTSEPPSAPSQVSPPNSPHAQAGSVHTSPVASPVCDPLQSGHTQVIPSLVRLETNPSPATPVQPEVSPSPGPASPMRCEAGPGSVSPVLATPGQSETSPSPGPTSPVQLDGGPGPGSLSVSIPQQRTQTERRESASTVGEYLGDTDNRGCYCDSRSFVELTWFDEFINVFICF